MIKWMQKTDIRAAAKEGALANCLQHHMQGRDATLTELRDAISDFKFDIDADYCAMCVHYKGFCRKCQLSVLGRCCDGLWRKLYSAFNKFKASPDESHHVLYVDAATEMCEYIETKLL